MLDPLTAASLAGTIVQFVDFGHKLLADGRELYKSNSGSLTVNEELRLITVDLHGLVKKLRGSLESSRPSPAGSVSGGIAGSTSSNHDSEITLEALCDKAATLAEELSARLGKLQLKGTKARKWDTMQQVVKNAWSRDEINGMNRRLSAFKDALETHLLFSLRETLNSKSLHESKCFQTLDDQNQLILSTLVKLVADGPEILSTITLLASRLEVANRDEHRRTRDLIIEDRRSRDSDRNIESITAGIEMLNVSPDQERDLRIRVEENILSNLRYESMTNRYEGIFEAHPKTFEWAFAPSAPEQMPWTNLGAWLQGGKGVYWISGKAGSGKSTLMKHLFEDPRTEKLLAEWARLSTREPAPLCIATYFFWNSGSPDQKSQAGMYRALLSQVFEQYPDLIPVVLPRIWAKEYEKFANGRGGSRGHESWSLRTLVAAFNSIFEQKSIPLKLCFFIDGLDEYDGDQEEISQLFKEITAKQSFVAKACVSSRPWPVFRECFETYPTLRLQDLTFSDIELYVRDRMLRNGFFQRLSTNDYEAAQMLIYETVERAEGVFLWVWLAVKSLLNGISNRDTMTDLRNRLQSTPTELESLYELILGQIEPVYLAWASKAFQIVRVWRELFKPQSENPEAYFPFTDHSPSEISTLTLEEFLFAINDDASYETDWDGQSSERLNIWHELEIHLNARCAGLLEVTNLEQGRRKGACPYSTVQYLHQTARDFLEIEARWKRILDHTVGANFNASYSMMKARAMSRRLQGDFCFHSIWQADSSIDHIDELTADFLNFVYHLDSENKTRVSRAVIKEGLRWGMSHSLGLRMREKEWSQWGSLLPGIHTRRNSFTFLCFAAELGLSDYVKQTLVGWNAPERKSFATGLLRHLVSPKEESIQPLQVEMISTLLQLEASPNWQPATPPGGVYIQPTTWQQFLLYGTEVSHKKNVLIQRVYILTMKLLLQAGADPTATIWWDWELAIPTILSKYISAFPEYPDEGAELFSILRLTLSIRRGG